MVRRGLPGRARAAARAPGERGAVHARGAGASRVRDRDRPFERTDPGPRCPGPASGSARGADRPLVEPRLGPAAIPGTVCGAVRQGAGGVLQARRRWKAWLCPGGAAAAPSEGAGVDQLTAAPALTSAGEKPTVS